MGLVLKLLKRFDIISKVLPTLFKNAAEGRMGPQLRAVYWWLAGKKTVTGAVLMAVGAGLETLIPSFPEWTWLLPVSQWVYWLGGALAAVGLVDGGTRSPWPVKPDGTASWQEPPAQ